MVAGVKALFFLVIHYMAHLWLLYKEVPPRLPQSEAITRMPTSHSKKRAGTAMVGIEVRDRA